jgi:hypothetical protein
MGPVFKRVVKNDVLNFKQYFEILGSNQPTT